MNRYVAALLAVLGLVGVLGVVLAIGRGFGNDEHAAVANAAVAKCSKATLHGTYLIAQNGVIVKQTEGGAPRGPFASAGYEVYDGHGHIKSVGSFNFNGNTFSSGFGAGNEHLAGTYTVKANCTGTTTYISDGMQFKTDMAIAPDGSKFTFVHTKPPEQVVAGLEVRVTTKRVAQ
jgi:hypothetical protein